jgi:hypothetical protein
MSISLSSAVEGKSASEIKADITKVSQDLTKTKEELLDAMEAVFGSTVGCEKEDEDEEEMGRKTKKRDMLERKVRALRKRLKSLEQECKSLAMWDAKSTISIVLMMDLQTVVQFAHTSSHIRSIIAGSFTHIMLELTPRYFGDEHLKLLQVVCVNKSPTESTALVTKLFATKTKCVLESEIAVLCSLMCTAWSLVDCARLFALKGKGMFEILLWDDGYAIFEWRNAISSLCKQRGWAEHDLIFQMHQARRTECTSRPGKPDLAAGFYNFFGPFENHDDPYVVQDWALRQRCTTHDECCHGCHCDFDVVKFAQEVKNFFVHIDEEAEQCQFVLNLTKQWKLTARLVLLALTYCEHWTVAQRPLLKEALGGTFDFRIIKELTGVEPRKYGESVPRCDAHTIVKVIKFTQAMWIGEAEEEAAAKREEEEIEENQRQFEAELVVAKQAFEEQCQMRVAQQQEKQVALWAMAGQIKGGAALRRCLMDFEEGETLECNCDICDSPYCGGCGRGCHCGVTEKRKAQQKMQLSVLTHFKNDDSPWNTEDNPWNIELADDDNPWNTEDNPWNIE